MPTTHYHYALLSAIGVAHEQNILPPVIADAKRRTRDMRQVLEPPEMMGAHIATAPLRAIDHAARPGEIGKVVPVVAKAIHRAAIAPVVIALAAGREMHIAAVRLARRDLVVASKHIPEVLFARMVAKHMAHDRLRAVAKIF